MCGIAGTWGPDVPRVERMIAALRHRGPDGAAVREHGGATLGCARLAIRGGERGAQPFAGERGMLVFNGEIYNSDELVKDLAWHGVEVDGSSDTEIVARLLDVYGMKAVDRLNGMFAFAWADGGRLHLARDPAGVKPLYYTDDAFASEIAPLLAGGRRALDATAFERWQVFHVAYGEETFFEGVRRVPAGGIVQLPDARVARRAAPGLHFSQPNPALNVERVRKVLERAVRDASPRGERYGVALSGGIDSTLVAALAEGDRIAFHGRVDHEGCDESPHARAAAAELGLPLVEVPITAEACWEALPQVVRALEEPVAGPGSVAQFLVARRAREEVRILLSGCGGDELFGGYARAVALVFDEPPPHWERYAPLFERVRDLPPAERAFALLDRRGEPTPLRDAFVEAFGEGELDPLAAAARVEMQITLPGLLQVEDRVTMAHGLEGRVPLLDRRLLRVAARLAPELRVDANGRAKAVLRDAASPHLPASVRARTDKMGFPLPLRDWFAGPWRERTREILLDRRTMERGWLDEAAVERALTGQGHYDRGLYSALLFELWNRTFLDETERP
ncbi:MAG: asparagine synthase (glutamine-hydrolyzing) [Planctomycetota bacterium]